MSALSQRLRDLATDFDGTPRVDGWPYRRLIPFQSARDAAAEIERLEREVAEANERVHYAEGTAELAIRHRNEAEATTASARAALKDCRTSFAGYAITSDDQYPGVLAAFWKELQRIDGIARAAVTEP